MRRDKQGKKFSETGGEMADFPAIGEELVAAGKKHSIQRVSNAHPTLIQREISKKAKIFGSSNIHSTQKGPIQHSSNK